MGKATGLRITRLFTKPGEDPLDSVEWSRRDSRITNPDGSVVFEMKDAEIPTSWSQVAADIMVSKYFRKAGVPQRDADGRVTLGDDGKPVLGPERSARQVIRRLTSTWRWWGERHGYFASEADAHAFEDELGYMLVHQMAAPNSPQWFNTGLHHAYGLTGPAQGFWYVDPVTGAHRPLPRLLLPPRPPRLLHPVDRGRPGQRGRHHGPVGPGGPPLQVRGGDRHQLLPHPRRERTPLGRWPLLRGDVLPQDRRPCRRGHQVGRHHPARRQDGHPRHRPSRRRGVHQLEEERGGQGPGAHRRRLPLRLQRRGLPDRLRPERQQLGAGHPRVHAGRRRRRRLGPHRPHRRPGDAHRQGAPPVAGHRRGRLGLRRPGGAVRRDHQRVAHVAGRRADPGLQPVLGVHVPRQHGVQPGEPEPGRLLRRRLRHLRHRGLPARHPAVDHGARRLGDHGPVPQPRDRPGLLRLPHPGPGLRQPRLAAHAQRHRLRLRRGPGHRRRPHRGPHRRLLCHLGRDGLGAGHLPPLRREPRGDAAGDPQPPAGRLRRPAGGVRGPLPPGGGHRPALRPGGAARRRPAGLGLRPRHGRAVRLPQRPGHLPRPHRDHLPADGLRHHRGGARLRPGEVQEAGRRRLLQDRQPVHRPGAAQPGLLPRGAGRQSCATWSAP